MCGIAGVVGVAPELGRDAGERMQAAMRHRGPDDEGIEVIATRSAAPIVLVHTRLAIVDLSPAGHQPMVDSPRQGRGGANVITFNGEIYNYRELWPDLERAGWPCRTRSDTEVILHAYRAWGARAVERLEGMFAFALFDSDRQVLFLARDRVGVKPLYYRRASNGGFLFASEVRALLAAGPELVPARLNHTALESFLAQGAVASDSSIVDGVSMLPPGECIVVDVHGRPAPSVRYWSVQFGCEAGSNARPADGSVTDTSPPIPRPLRFRSEAVAEVSWALRRAVQHTMLADVPVGLFLSSGIDSSSLAVLATEQPSGDVRSIGVGFDQAEFDESAGAALIADELGTSHTQVMLSGDSVLNNFERVLAAMDQPTVDGFNTYFVSKAAREAGLTVALSGLGGDEIFGGYASFRDLPIADFVTKPLAWLSSHRGFLGMSTSNVPRLFRSRGVLKGVAGLARPGDLVGLYFLRRELFLPQERRALHQLPGGSDPITGLETATIEALRNSHTEQDTLDRIAFLEFSSYMRHMLLRDADVFSMAHSLEVRVPMLEHYVVERAAAASSYLRKPDPRLKPLLVDAVGPRLPSATFRNKKRGFTFPWGAWMRGALKKRTQEAVAERATWQSIGVDSKAVADAFARFHAGDRGPSPLELLALVVLEDFCRRHRIRG
jgi:asparagine synthase (glutamine-hydrolysing)